MNNSRSRLSQLFYAYLHDTITDEQRVEFLELTSREELHEELNALLRSFIETEGVEYNLDEDSAERIFTAIRKENNFDEAPLVLHRRWNWKKLAVAASVLARPKADEGKPGHVPAPMPGVISTVSVKLGQPVKAGDALMSIEAMKMETQINAPRDGIVVALLVAVGAVVEPKDLLVELQVG